MKFYSVALKEFVDKLFQKHIHFTIKSGKIPSKQKWELLAIIHRDNVFITSNFHKIIVIYWFQKGSIEKKKKD